MLDFLRGKVTERKIRLLACAVSYRYARLFSDDWYVRALRLAEQFADDGIVTPEVEATRRQAEAVFEELRAHYFPPSRGIYRSFYGGSVSAAQHLIDLLSERSPLDVPINVVWWATAAYPLREPAEPLPSNPEAADRAGRAAIEADLADYPALIREVVGNPFRRVVIPPAWRSQEVVDLAECAYRSRSFDLLPKLADALEAAGCHNLEVLRHCREANRHIPGCWVLDLMLGNA